MSATYNWAYRPGVTNKYGFTIPAGADNTRPTGWSYVALFGNDSTGNGSRQYPYRTITKAAAVASSNGFIVVASGVYREVVTIALIPQCNLIGDGDVIIDISYIQYLTANSGSGNGGYYNVRIKGNGINSYIQNNSNSINAQKYTDVFFDGVGVATQNNSSSCSYLNCVFSNFSGSICFADNASHNIGNVKGCTFVNCNNIQLCAAYTTLDSNVFYYCNISATNNTTLLVQYTLFFNCNFKLNGILTGGVLYPLTPTGYTNYTTISALQAAFFALYSTASFTNCTIADPLFNNSTIGDYSLSFASPAKNLSYFGTYVGAKSIAYPVKASAIESSGAFDFSTNVNLTIANDSITLVNNTINAEIKTKLIINANGRQIQKFPLYGFNADRNGQYVDSIAELNTVYKNPGDTLTTPTPYLVEGFAIIYNGNVYQIGDRLTTVSGITTFTSGGAGTLREILEAPERHTIMARFSDGGAPVSAGDALISGYWYYVISGSVTYDSVAYTAGQGFKAVDTNAFAGSGTVQIALSTESFQHYEPGIQPTSNNTGDTRTGSIIRGNGDPAYVRGGYGVQEFPINAKFIQLYYIINVTNLKP